MTVALDSATKDVINQLRERYEANRYLEGALSCGAAHALIETAECFQESGILASDIKIMDSLAESLKLKLHDAWPYTMTAQLERATFSGDAVAMLMEINKYVDGFLALDDNDHDPSCKQYSLGVIDHSDSDDLETYRLYAQTASEALSAFTVIYPNDDVFQVVYVAQGDLNPGDFLEEHHVDGLDEFEDPSP